MARTFQEFEFSNIQIWNFQIQNLEESMKNFDENTKIVFLDQLKWKFWFFEFLKFLKWAGDRDMSSFIIIDPSNKNPKFKWNQN